MSAKRSRHGGQAMEVSWVTRYVQVVAVILCVATLASAQGRLISSDILIANRKITVPLGRSVYITPNDLQIRVRPNDRCEVTVLDNDALSQRPGKIMPSVFPCDFDMQDVQYSHFGSRNPAEDRIRLQIRYDTRSQTYIIPLTIHIEVSFVQLEVVTRNMPIEVTQLMGVSEPIDSSVLEFAYDRPSQVCKVTVLSSASGLPRYGIVMNDTSRLQMVDCDEFLEMGVRYKHTSQTNSPDQDFIPLVVELLEKDDGSMDKQEYFQVMARIRGGLVNSRPQASYNALLVMEVDQFVMTAITPEVLAAEDLETPAEKLIFNITTPLGPGEGHIVSTDDRNQPIKSFYQKDITDLKIAYKPPPEDSHVQRVYQVAFEVIDSDGLASEDPIMLMIVVKPMNTLAPVVTRNTGLQLFEGQSRVMKSDLNLQISDENNLQNVRIYVADGLRHGQLDTPGNRKFFTPADLDRGAVRYRHDDSDTYSDNIIFRMTDGKNDVEFLYPITVFPEDDEPPILNVNTGLEIRKNEVAEISPFVLSATDIDSDDASIRFVLEPPYSDEGVILRRQFQIPRDPRNWQLKNGVYEQIVEEFTQKDILDGKMFYQHVGPHRSDFVMDTIRFRLADSGDPPNQSGLEEFTVKIAPVDDQLPYLYPNIPLSLKVSEFEMTSLKKKFLRYTDDDTEDRKLKYDITALPFDTDRNTPLEPGTIVLCDHPDRGEISSFTQAQVNHHKVCFKPPGVDMGIMPRIIQFGFSVTDESGNVLPDQRFTVNLKPVNNKPPEIINKGVEIEENGFTVIDTDILDVNDMDTMDEDILFRLTEKPSFGILRIGEEELVVDDTFNKDDLISGKISYMNIGEEMTSDKFRIDVSDGMHHVPITFKIKVKSIDDEAPKLLGDVQAGVLGVSIKVPENSVFTLRPDDFKATDPDTEDLELVFVLHKHPYEGIILKNGRQTESFSQKDIMDEIVQYQHTGGEVGEFGRNDSFSLILLDKSDSLDIEGNRINRIMVDVEIVPVNSEPPLVSVVEEFAVRENDKSPILPIHLDAIDIDTDDTEIICTITSAPTYGYIENEAPAPGSEKPRTGMPVSAFTIGDVRRGTINYVQSVHKGVEPRRDRFVFRCSDGVNYSPSLHFNLAIVPSNDEEPQVFLREFMVLEGMNLMIDTPILSVIDTDDPPGELTFTITKKPEHGSIVQQRPSGTYPIQSFTLEDISGESTIEYEHDDTETTEDSFEFYLTDGVHNITKTVPIIVIPVDDETPRLTINNGLELENGGETKTITNEHLKAEDLDSNDPDILFIVRRLPKYGYIQKQLGDRIQNLTLGLNFTQRDIDEERIQYVHTGLEGVRDLIKFDVTDTLNPLIDRYFYVTVEGIDMTFPTVINKGVELPEGGMVTLTTDLLSGTDLSTPDQNLQFIVTRAPGRGHLESADMPGVPITAFTQLELAGNKIRYVHTSEDEMKMDSFEFEVTDGFNPVSRTFRISLSDIDNKKPVVMFQTLRLKEGDNKLITPFELKADDRDTTDEHVTFTITQVPVHGNILFNNTKVIATFTMEDLNNNMISYQHDGSETIKDSFSFTVTDGTHSDYFVFPETTYTTRQAQVMKVEIIPVDNGVPQIAVNRGASFLSAKVGGSLAFPITEKYLQIKDRDSADDRLKYTLTVEPEYGYIINTNLGNKSISQWTQGDIARHQIEYVLIPGVNATSDSFFFKIEDKGGNILGNQPFHLNWAWISLESDKLFVNETDKKLKVNLRRRGYLGETSFVTINVVNGTAKVGEDINPRYAEQVQFNPGQMEKVWRLRIIDDEMYEEAETFTLELASPVMAVLEYPDSAKVTITDKEDESTVTIPDKEYRVSEDIGEVLIPVRREGDLSDELMVICSTTAGSAVGTIPGTVTSFSDYITRTPDHRNIIRFDKDEEEKYCRVMIIDDSLYEGEENFTVILTEPMGGRIGDLNKTLIIIEPDKSDEPTFYFGESEYSVDESDGFVEVKIWRTGTDLSKPSSVTVRSRRTDPQSAKSGLDYIAVNKNLEFAPGVTMQTVRITILDDLGKPRLEGSETFQVVLRMPMAAMLGEPSSSVIMINDSQSDVPSMHFKEAQYEGHENDGSIKAVVVRTGDASKKSTVRCYTRQDTAKVMDDYVERPDTNASVIVFLPGEYEKECEVQLTNDSIYEEDEKFRLVLGEPLSPGFGSAKLGKNNYTTVTLKDDGDKPVIKFEMTKFVVKEPMFKEEISIMKIPVIREGDVGHPAVVSVNTKDGSANAGKDYNGIFKELTFEKNISRQEVEIEILFDGQKEMREVFTVHLRQKTGIAEVKNPKVMVYIEERSKVADVTFPSPPMVVSLRDYDDIEDDQRRPIQGYPVVCVTPCNPKHPDYLKTGELCTDQGINDTLTLFRWRTSAPTGADGVSSDLKDVDSNTFFASTKGIALDSIYFAGGSRIQCGARAVNTEGDPGLELLSEPVTVSMEEGICEPREMNTIGAEPFTSKVKYTGPDDEKHPNKVMIAVTIPHRDGMMPVVSTKQLSNFELTLSRDGTRVATHRCSNLLDFDEHDTQFGFITNATKNPNIIGETEPYQYSSEIRSKPTLRFYRNLNLDSCLWEFVSYYDMSELISDCGGDITTDGQVLDAKQSYVSLRVPLYVSYIFHSPVATGGWTHYDMQSQLPLTFVYDTAILWQNGISSPEGETGLQGYLFPTSMRIQDNGRLSVTFRTEARFMGQFVLGHKSTNLESMVMSPDLPSLSFTLKQIQSQPTFEQPEQTWEFVSDYAVRDYSGLYKIQLIPCTTSIDQEYSLPLECNPRTHLNFDLPIRFQQVSDPVPTKFSLNTDFHLMRKKSLWLSDGSMGFGDEIDAAFSPADKIYGRINVDPVQNLGQSFALNVEKVFLCSGKDGYIPKYDPENGEFGCVAENENLQHVFKILDKGAPFTQVEKFRDIPFNARLASSDPDAVPLVQQPGADGFSLDGNPLFKVDGGRQWFLHGIYTVRSKENSDRGIGKRSIEYHSVFNARQKRSQTDTAGIGEDGKGTNMVCVKLDYENEEQIKEVETTNDNKYPTLLIVIISCIGIFLLICVLIIVICIVTRRRKHTSPPPTPTNTIIVAGAGGTTRVVTPQHFNNDNTEV